MNTYKYLIRTAGTLIATSSRASTAYCVALEDFLIAEQAHWGSDYHIGNPRERAKGYVAEYVANR
jgi:hypothetical protein